MRAPFLIYNLRSNYCKTIFAGSLIIGYLLTPKDVLVSNQAFIALLFIFLFALTMACTARTLKEKIKSAATMSGSTIGVMASVVGITTLQVCGMSTPLCGASLGAGLLSAIFPGIVVNLFRGYSLEILITMILAQGVSLYVMNCFQSTKIINN